METFNLNLAHTYLSYIKGQRDKELFVDFYLKMDDNRLFRSRAICKNEINMKHGHPKIIMYTRFGLRFLYIKSLLHLIIEYSNNSKLSIRDDIKRLYEYEIDKIKISLPDGDEHIEKESLIKILRCIEIVIAY